MGPVQERVVVQLQRFPRLLQTPQREKRPERPDRHALVSSASIIRRHVRWMVRTTSCKHASGKKPTKQQGQRQLRESDDGAR